MNIIDIIQESLRSLKMNLKRTFLTVLGIVIGIFAVTIMLSVGDGIKKSISADLNSAKQGDVTIRSGNSNRQLDKVDLNWVKNQLYVKEVIAINQAPSGFVRFSDKDFNINLESIVGPFDKLEKIKLVSGKAFDWNDEELDTQIILVDSVFAQNFLKKTGQNIFEKKITIKGKPYEVIGVYQAKPSSFQFNDGQAYIPFKTMNSLLSGKNGYSTLAIHLKNQEHYEIASEHLQKGLNLSRGLSAKSYDFVYVNTPQANAEQIKKIAAKFNLFLGIIGGISLLVGGIGTMNMMLTTISERTKEIGLRKAIGARDADITLQILFESIFVTLIGGILGIIFTWIVVLVANPFIPKDAGFKLSMSMSVVSIAVIVSVVVGIIFGVSPAKKAAKLQPVDALRSD